jgi:glycosyltransferase involved in cell wall biosynthesis
MKVLYVARLFSGFETSMIDRIWRPTGVPTVYKIIEALDASGDLELLLTVKDGHSLWRRKSDETFRIEGLKARISVLAGTSFFPTFLGRLRRPLRELRQIFKIFQASHSLKPDLIYVDHGNIWAAGLLARMCQIPVVFRVMGIKPVMRDAYTNRYRVAHFVLRWCYRAPFAMVICTQDGTGAEGWVKYALGTTVPFKILINGVPETTIPDDVDERLQGISNSRVVILFLGSLEPSKGPIEFVDAFLDARQKCNAHLHALIVGAGSLEDQIRTRIAESRAINDVTFIDRLAHSQVLAAQDRADIYVSLNRFGNLSNANLEAICMGAAMVIPCSQPKTGVDLITDSMIPKDAAWRINSSDDHTGLVAALTCLADAPEQRHAMSDAINDVAKLLSNWSQRIDQEMTVLSELTTQKTEEYNKL